MPCKEVRTFLRELKDRGYEWVITGGGHVRIMWQGETVAYTPSTPHGGKRGMNNLKAEIKRFERQLAERQAQGDVGPLPHPLR